ncbi:hypothetical protein AVEN_50508-1 [Araneus ventricosus]|uniref:Uncharacterized protein n=1 Tax=Araneus ventricosus TaxID=182803 RepID=A0A4Y2AQZ2_ARAVE|nr:hypothetical protein AVEN_50508-1 [Araneus ventricosus]
MITGLRSCCPKAIVLFEADKQPLTLRRQTNSKSRVCIQWSPSHVGVFGNEVADLLTKEGSALPSAASGDLFASEISSTIGLKQILIGKSLPHTNGMLEIVLVCLYSPKVQDPHRLHWPDFVVAISKA